MSVECSNSVGAPAYFGVNFFQDVLENVILEPNVEIKKIAFEMGCAAGENYCSKIYRVKLSFQSESGSLGKISVILKNISVTDNTQFLEDLKFFLKEKIAFNSILPRMEILLDNVKLVPKLYHSQKEPVNTLVFEDLCALGYVMADRVQGLDLKHCKMVLEKLGQFHAASMIMHQKEPESMKMFQHGILSEKGVNGSDFYELHFGNCIQGLIELIGQWEGYESITEKIRNYKANLKEKLIRSQQPIAGELMVLNHGDLWVNNVLFKYKDDGRQQLLDVVYVDLQLGIYGSPGYDINYFLYSSAQPSVLKDRRDEVLTTYHAAMCETLKAHKYTDMPTFNDILTEVRRRELFGVFACFCILPGVALDKKEAGDTSLEKLMDEELAKKYKALMFQSQRIKDTMRFTLKRFDEMGVLD